MDSPRGPIKILIQPLFNKIRLMPSAQKRIESLLAFIEMDPLLHCVSVKSFLSH